MPEWSDCVDAARRKLEIATFHYERLRESLSEAAAASAPPPIPIQAFFEGVVFSVVAAIDQVAQAANEALGLKLSPEQLFEGAYKEIELRVASVKEWRSNPLGVDLR